jgi:hypothetical protein
VQLRDAQADFFQRGGFGLVQTRSSRRDFYGARSPPVRPPRGQAGLSTSSRAPTSSSGSGGQQIDVFANPENAALPICSHFYWTTPDATVGGNAPLSP